MLIQRLKCRYCTYNVWSNSIDKGITCPDCGRDGVYIAEVRNREPAEDVAKYSEEEL